MHLFSREHVDGDLDRLALVHIGELRFLEIRDHVGSGSRHQGHQLRAGLNELASAQRAVAHHAIDRSRNRRVAEIEFGLPLQGGGARRGGDGLPEFCPEQIDVLERGSKVGSVTLDRGFRTGIARLCVLRILYTAKPGRSEMGVAFVFLARKGLVRVVDLDSRLRRLDHGLLDLELGLLACDSASAAATSALAWSSATLKSRSSIRASTWPAFTRSLSPTRTSA